MSATKSLSARIPERHGAVVQQNWVRLEELENRMLLSRVAFSGDYFGTGDNTEPSHEKSAPFAIVARGSTDTTSAAPTYRVAETRTIVLADEPSSGSPTASGSSQPSQSDTSNEPFTPAKTDPSPRTGLRRIEAKDEPAPTDPPASDAADEPVPTPIRPVRQEPVRNVEKTDEPTTQPAETAAETAPEKSETRDDTSTRPSDTERPDTIDQSPSCVAQDTDSTSNTECQTQQLANIAQPSNGSEETQESVTTDRGNTETIAKQAASPESSVSETQQSAESPPRREPQDAEASANQWSEAGLPQTLLADALTDALADEHTAVADSELGQTVFAAGAFAVAFSKPLSRLTGSDSSTFGDPAAPSALPVAFTRKRRKEARRSAPGTKNKPDDTDDPDESQEPSRGRGPARESMAAFDGAERFNSGEQYDSIEAAIHATLHAFRDSSEDSTHAGGMFHSAKSFAAGALAAATALLTLQGTRRPERSRPALRPAAPTYHGQTAVAAS